MVKEILGALEFAAFLGGLAWLCHIVERLPIVRKINHLLGLDGESVPIVTGMPFEEAFERKAE